MPGSLQALWGQLSGVGPKQCSYMLPVCVCLQFLFGSRENTSFAFVPFSCCTKPASQWVPDMCFVQLKGEQHKQDIWSGVSQAS